MTARNAAAIASLALIGATAACTNFYEVPIETPIQAKLDVGAFRRVLVAGFISGGTDDVDANMETVRLLRSQLRTKTNLRVIEAEVLPLVDLAQEQAQKAGDLPLPTVTDIGGGQAAAPRPQDPAAATSPDDTKKPEAPTGAIRTKQDLERYERIFADAASSLTRFSMMARRLRRMLETSPAFRPRTAARFTSSARGTSRFFSARPLGVRKI